MTTVSFHWDADTITPRLLIAVGRIILDWAMIDAEVTKMVMSYWPSKKPGERPPKSFDRRVRDLLERAAELYADEPAELRTFRWYVQRLRTISGHRDDISHGMPGTITQHGRTYEGVMVPSPGGPTRYVPRTLDEIDALAQKVTGMKAETLMVSFAFRQALTASSPDTQVWQDRGAWMRLTMENRSPKLPRENPPPPTFQG